MAMHHPNLWQLRYAGSILPRGCRSDYIQLRLAFLTALPLQFTVLHITERTVAQMEATS
jgi:hypothetical protein